MLKTQTPKTVVDVDLRRKVFMQAKARKPHEVAKVPHEAFIRNLLKDSMGWRRDQPAPESIKAVARQMAAQFKTEDLARSAAVRKAREEQADRERKAAKDAQEAPGSLEEQETMATQRGLAQALGALAAAL